MATFSVATAHSLILTVSHDLLSRQPLVRDGTGAAVSLHKVSQLHVNPTHESEQLFAHRWSTSNDPTNLP